MSMLIGDVAKASKNKLSGREDEIIQMAMQGLTDKQIAARMSISTATVKSYWVRIRQKLGGFNRTEAVAKMLREQGSQQVQTKGKPVHQYWQALCRHSSLTAIVVDLDGEISSISRLPHGGTSDHMIGRSIVDLCEPVYQSFMRTALRSVQELRRSSECRIPLSVGPGTMAEFSGVLAPLEEGCEVTGAILFADSVRTLAPARPRLMRV